MKNYLTATTIIVFTSLALVLASGLATPNRSAQAFPGADNFKLVDQACDGFGKVTARFSWTSYNNGDQWLDVSTVNSDFVWGTFFGHGPFTTGQNNTDRGGLTPDTTYHARVNTAVFPFWIPSSLITFKTIACQPSGTPTGSPLQTCDAFGNVTARFVWQSYGQGDYWLDVSTVNGNFIWGEFFGSGPFSDQQTSMDRGGLKPNTVYWVRVNAAIFPYWIPTPTFSFQTINCSAATATPTPTVTSTPGTATPTVTVTQTPQ